MSVWNFSPIVGLTGAGKSAWLNRSVENGAQVISVEFLAGVTGVCLRNLTGPVISAAELELALMAKLAQFDQALPVYVEWKPELVHRVELPEWFVTQVRASTAWCVVASFESRIDRLLTDYGSLAEHLDYVVDIFERSGVLPEVDMCVLRGFQVADDARGMVAFLLEHYFDPLYVNDIKTFASVGFGRFSESGGAFFGSVQFAPYELVGLCVDGVLSDSCLIR
jgi:hypothetical protein